MVWVIGGAIMIFSLLATTILKLLFEPDKESDRKVGIAPLVTDETNGKDGQPDVEEEEKEMNSNNALDEHIDEIKVVDS